MTQEQAKENIFTYFDYNLNAENKKEVLKDLLQELDLKEQIELSREILEDISNFWYYEGYTKESNTLTTITIQLQEILKER